MHDNCSNMWLLLSTVVYLPTGRATIESRLRL